MRGILVTATSWLVLAAALATPAAAQGAPSPRTGPAAQRVVLDDSLPVIAVYGDRQSSDPGSYSVVGAAAIETVQANHPAEILNTVPGVNVQANSGQELLVAIRSPVLSAGAGQGSFLLLENGVPIRAPAFGNVNALFEVHHETAETIEVVRGPASVRYGSNAVHGLVNVIDREPAAEPGYSAGVSVSSLNRYRLDAAGTIRTGGARHYGAVSMTDETGWRDASGVDMQKLTLRSDFDLAGWNAVSTIAAVNLNQETAGFAVGPDVYRNRARSTANPNPEAYRDAWAARANVKLSRQVGPGVATLTPFAVTQRMIFIQHFLPDQSTEKNGHDSLGVLGRYEFGTGEGLDWTIGADVQWASGYLKEIQTRPTFGAFPQGVHYDYEVETLALAAFVEADWRIAKDWKLVGGLRAESHGYDYETRVAPGVRGRFRVPASREDDFDLLTPKLGLIWTPAGEAAALYANYARGERAPQASDQYRLQNLQTEAALEVETLDSFEVGARGELRVGKSLKYDAAVYLMNKDSFFFRDADGLNVPNGKTRHVGVELALDGVAAAGVMGGELGWSVAASWSDQTYEFDRNVANSSEDIVKGTRIDTAPEWQGDASVNWTGEQLTLAAGVEYVGEYFTDAANLHAYPGHLIGRATAAYRFSDRLEAFSVVRNLTDTRYADRADFANNQDRYFPGEPLNVTVGVRVKG